MLEMLQMASSTLCQVDGAKFSMSRLLWNRVERQKFETCFGETDCGAFFFTRVGTHTVFSARWTITSSTAGVSRDWGCLRSSQDCLERRRYSGCLGSCTQWGMERSWSHGRRVGLFFVLVFWSQLTLFDRSANVWTLTVMLRPGVHHVRFLVDGQWCLADDLPLAVDDHGSLANYIAVPIPISTPAPALALALDRQPKRNILPRAPPPTTHRRSRDIRSSVVAWMGWDVRYWSCC